MGAGRRRRGRLAGFLCFGAASVVEDEEEVESSIGSSARSADLGLPGDETESRGRSRRRRVRRSLSKIFRSVSFGSSQRSKRLEEFNEKSSLGSSRKSSDVDDPRTDRIFSSPSVSSSSSSSSSSSRLSSSSSSSFQAAPRQPDAKPRRRRALSKAESRKAAPQPARRSYPTSTLWLWLTSMCFLMVCGRICAILWTSTWLYLLLRRNTAAAPPAVAQAAAKPSETRSKEWEEYEKKRVVLQGLLERNRRL